VTKSAEFIVELDQNQLLVLTPLGESFSGILSSLRGKPGLQLIECAGPSELISVSRQIGTCAAVVYCPKPAEAERYQSIVNALADEILNKKMKVVVVLGAVGELNAFEELKHRFFQAGACDVVDELSGMVTIRDTIHRAIAVLPSRKSLSKKTAAYDLSWAPPLRLESDCWLTLRDTLKQIAGKWFLSLIGPLPRYGQWCAMDLSENPAFPPSESVWEWVPTDLMNDPFIHEEGAWVFRGEKPEFKGGSWRFIGPCIELSFLHKGASYGTKFSSDSKSMVIAEDSDHARSVVKRIEALEEAGLSGCERITPSKERCDAAEEQAIEAQKPHFILDPLKLGSDCFAREERVPRFINQVWIMRLAGPTPAHGKWEFVRQEELEEPTWQWIPNQRDSFIVDPGCWIFQGNEPIYRDGLWTFGGKKARMDFVTNVDSSRAKVLARKISVDSRGAFLLAEDSPAALAALEKLTNARKKPPVYLKRAKDSGKVPELGPQDPFENALLHPLTAAYFISELMRRSDISKAEALKSFCELLSGLCGGGGVEAWIMRDSEWMCLTHEDLMDFALLQKVRAMPVGLGSVGAPPQTSVLEAVGSRAVLVCADGEKIGMFLFSGEKTAVFKNHELQAYAKACSGLWIALAQARGDQTANDDSDSAAA
jgi:hypothetical protein